MRPAPAGPSCFSASGRATPRQHRRNRQL